MESRQELLEQFRHLDSMKPVRDAFEAVGTSAPVLLTREQKADLIQVIEHWGSQVAGGLTDGLPEGIFGFATRSTTTCTTPPLERETSR